MSDAMLNVLFVDDEPRVLEGIERMMFDVAEDWVIDTAQSGEEALSKLAQDDYAIVVSDMRMPCMDGATLLAQIAERHPRVVRVILSGQTDEEAMMRAVPVAHRFLAKPCGAEALYEVVRRTERLCTELADPDLRASITRLGLLPSPPALYTELVQVLRDPEVTLDALSTVVCRDPSLAARVLQIANSAFFSRAAVPVTQLRSAIARIGTRVLRSLALSSTIFAPVSDHRGKLAVEKTQAHALRAAEVALRLASDHKDRDDAFTGALLHDVGLIALWAIAPEGLADIPADPSERLEAERRAFGATHAEIGAHLLDLWGLPLPIVEAVHAHHTPDAIPRAHARVAAITYLANALVNGAEPSPAIVEAYGLAEDVARARLDDGGASC
jgi:putative nucleotidyltransferase with HDIG domain